MVDMPDMQEDTVKIRRGKRTDLPALATLLTPGLPCEANKARARHWRRLASDPSHDFYVAEQAGTLRGMVLVCYIHELRRPGWQAILDIVAPSPAECGIGQALLAFARKRARKRGCQRLLMCISEGEGNERGDSLVPPEFRRVGEVLSCEVV